MTAPALVKQSDLKRMAVLAKRENVTVWIEVDGKKVGVSPVIPESHRDDDLEHRVELRL